jgi:hypothetical protein
VDVCRGFVFRANRVQAAAFGVNYYDRDPAGSSGDLAGSHCLVADNHFIDVGDGVSYLSGGAFYGNANSAHGYLVFENNYMQNCAVGVRREPP